MKLHKNDAIIVKWEDIVQESGWRSEESAGKLEPVVCRSLGFFLNQDKRVIRLSDTVSSDGDRNITVIPCGCVLKIRRWDEVRR